MRYILIMAMSLFGQNICPELCNDDIHDCARFFERFTVSESRSEEYNNNSVHEITNSENHPDIHWLCFTCTLDRYSNWFSDDPMIIQMRCLIDSPHDPQHENWRDFLRYIEGSPHVLEIDLSIKYGAYGYTYNANRMMGTLPDFSQGVLDLLDYIDESSRFIRRTKFREAFREAVASIYRRCVGES